MEKVNPWPARSWPEVLSETKSCAETIAKQEINGSRTFDRIIEPVFGRYVTRNHEFREELEDLVAALENFAGRPRVKRPFNILLSAEPGSGKSFLLKQLAKRLSAVTEVEFDEYHVSAFVLLMILTAPGNGCNRQICWGNCRLCSLMRLMGK